MTKKSNPMLIAAVLVLAGMLSVLNSTILSPVLPTIMGEMSIGATTAQWLLTGYTLMNAIVVPVSAFLMGKFDTKKLFTGSMIFLSLGSLVGAIAPNFVILMIGRALQAIAAGMLMPLVVTVLMLVFPVEKRGMVMGLYTLSVSVAPAIGPVLIGVLADTIGWQSAFYGTAFLCLILGLLGIRLLDPTIVGKEATMDFYSLVISALALIALLYGFTIMGDGQLGFGILLALLGAIGVFLFARRQLTMQAPYLDIHVMKTPSFLVGMLVAAIFNAVLPVLMIVLPLYMQDVLGASTSVSGLALTPIAIGAALASVVAGLLYDKLGIRKVVLAASVLGVAGVAWILLSNNQTPVWIVSATATLLAMGTMAACVPLNTWSVSDLRGEEISHGNALSSTVRQIFSSLLPAATVSIMTLISTAQGAGGSTTMLGVSSAYILCAVLVAIAILIFVFGYRAKERVA